MPQDSVLHSSFIWSVFQTVYSIWIKKQLRNLHRCPDQSVIQSNLYRIGWVPNCLYTVNLGEDTLSLLGCSHMCKKEIEEKKCCPGFWGTECYECPGGPEKPCSGHGTCLDGITRNGTCTCEGRYGGFACQDCLDENLFGPDCQSVCDCQHGVCNHGISGDGSCTCHGGYTGPKCDQELPLCRGVACGNKAQCVLMNGMAICDCMPGYRKSGSICQAQDPCTSSPCSSLAVCKALSPEKYECTCKDGYHGDGKICQPINPCIINNGGCPENTTICIYKGPGKVSCVCKDGEIGDGRSCYKNLMSEISQMNTRGRWYKNLDSANKMFGNDTIAQHLCKMHIIPGQHLVEDMIKTKTLWTLSGHQLTFNDRIQVSQHRTRYQVAVFIAQLASFETKGALVLALISLESHPFFPLSFYLCLQKTIGEILASMEIFSRFETILENCGLPSILDGPGPFTVFVPSNNGVDKLRDGRLIYLFTEHCLLFVYIFQVTAEKLITMPQIITMANQILTINITENGRILLDDSGIPLNKRDIVASNGIIHTLDGIFIPPSIIPILPQRCNEEQHKIIAGSCVDCGAMNTSVCPPHSTKMEVYPSECVYVHDPLGLNVLKKGCARYCNQTILKPGCCKGFFGPDCTPCPGGFSNPCYGRGNCSDGMQGNGNCLCFEGFKGIACHICSNPNKHGENCDEDCGCIHGICDNRPGSKGKCQSRSCKDGYTGEFCDRTSQNCGPTASQYCHRNAVCSLNNTARLLWFYFNLFSFKFNLPFSPPPQAICTSTGPGTATCQCNKGWTGDGKACVAIDNCVLETRGDCHMNADCSFVGPGQSKCMCKSGYAGDGYNCESINPCKLDNGGCHDLAVCEPLGGGDRSCACAPGYMGDGLTCYGDVLKKSLFSIPAGVSVTVLVPTEAAIKNLSQAEKDFWLKPYTLPFLVRSHFLQGSFTSEHLKEHKGEELPTLNPRTRWEITNSSGVRAITIQNAVIVVADIPAINGTIYILNKVLLPPLGDIPPSRPGLQQQLDMVPAFTLFKELLLQYQLIGSIESSEKYTIFVPGNNSIGEYCHSSNITQLDNDTVQYHVVLGEKLSSTDLKNGVHKSTMLGVSYWLMFYKNNNQTFVNSVRLDGKFFETKNGMLIGVSGVLQIQKNRCTANTTVIQKMPYSSLLCPFSKVSICCPGYYGHMCEMCPGKPGSSCSGNGVCQDGITGSGECRCHEGFHGTACEMCEVGRYGAGCKSVCTCRNGICNDGLHGDGSCKCFQGWEGITCERISSFSEPEENCIKFINCIFAMSIHWAWICIPLNLFLCCFLVTEINPCVTDNGGCSIYATCINVSAGENTCTCKEGYAGDGTLCQGEICSLSSYPFVPLDYCKFSILFLALQNSFVFPSQVACNCLPGYSGDGVQQCVPINLCSENNGGCSQFGFCKYTGPGTRNCSCGWAQVGDGFTCRGSVYQVGKVHSARIVFERALAFKIKELSGEGPFTIFVPHADSIQNSTTVSSPSFRITEVAEAYGYKIYSKLLRVNAELLSLVNNSAHRPFTMLWPTDAVFNALPKKMQSWLYNKDHRDKLAAYLKMHMIRDMKVVAGNLPHIASVRTMHGSTISFSCTSRSLPSLQGELLVDNGNAKIVQRHMEFDGGIAYGIDQLLEPPNLGSRCDDFLSVELRVSALAPINNKGKSQSCFYYLNPFSRLSPFSHRNYLLSRPHWYSSVFDSDGRRYSLRRSLTKGCKRVCFSTSWVPQCCANHYGRDCHVCPGGLEAPCSNRGTCDDRINGSGRCNCTEAFIGTACELCAPGRYGPDCQECKCTENGMCNEGLNGDGICFCTEEWTGERCETKLAATPVCSPACHPNASCRAENICECNLHYEGDGRTCTVIDQCRDDNGGCSEHANCTQVGVHLSCTCLLDYQGDGYVCSPIDRCADGRNGDCSEHALCISTGPNARKCECKAGYVGNGIQCLEEAVPPTNRCLEENGYCHPEAICTDLHFQDKTIGVFHLQSPRGKYTFTYVEAEAACMAEDAALATLQQLSAAQQMGFHLCLVGWLSNGTAGYPTVYPTASCGSNHVGIVDYGSRKNLTERWDAFCYRAKDVRCNCRDGFIGDGYSCSGNLLAVLAEHSNFSTFYSMLLDYTNTTQDGLEFLNFLSNDTAYKTLFVPLNSGFRVNMTLTWEEVKLHVSLSDVSLLSFNLTNGTVIPSCSGYNLLIADAPLLNSTQPPVSMLGQFSTQPASLGSR
uniref:Stabilin 1 n=1 Tax=Gopherus evgoodei TaxID=1825980 RepID=A0A8C4WPY8_9SAUR